MLCGISVRVDRADGTADWVTKWDGADNSQVEAVKGGLSGSMKRAAVQWGVGRYLYDVPSPWVRLDDRGRFAETPKIPRQFLPRRAARPLDVRRAVRPARAVAVEDASVPDASVPDAGTLGAVTPRRVSVGAVAAGVAAGRAAPHRAPGGRPVWRRRLARA